jgi:hypothetical protein
MRKGSTKFVLRGPEGVGLAVRMGSEIVLTALGLTPFDATDLKKYGVLG